MTGNEVLALTVEIKPAEGVMPPSIRPAQSSIRFPPVCSVLTCVIDGVCMSVTKLKEQLSRVPTLLLVYTSNEGRGDTVKADLSSKRHRIC